MPILELPVVCPGVDSEIRVVKGTAKSFKFNVGQTLVSATVRIDVRRRLTDPVPILTKSLSIVGPPIDGNVQLDFVALDYDTIPAGKYSYVVFKTVASVDTAIFAGTFFLEPFIQLAITGSTERISVEVRDENNVLANPDDLTVQLLDPSDGRAAFYPMGDANLINPEGG